MNKKEQTQHPDPVFYFVQKYILGYLEDYGTDRADYRTVEIVMSGFEKWLKDELAGKHREG